MKTAYQIKTTYLSGAHKGKSYILTKGGYITDEGQVQPSDLCYSSERVAKTVCARMKKRNELDHAIEERDRAWREAHGKENSLYWVHDLEEYEPVEVECY